MEFIQEKRNYYINNEKVSKKEYFSKLKEKGVNKKNYESIFSKKNLGVKINRRELEIPDSINLTDNYNPLNFDLENKIHTFEFEIKGDELEDLVKDIEDLGKVFQNVDIDIETTPYEEKNYIMDYEVIKSENSINHTFFLSNEILEKDIKFKYKTKKGVLKLELKNKKIEFPVEKLEGNYEINQKYLNNVFSIILNKK